MDVREWSSYLRVWYAGLTRIIYRARKLHRGDRNVATLNCS